VIQRVIRNGLPPTTTVASLTVTGSLTTNGPLVVNDAFCLDAETIQTANYQILDTDSIVIMNDGGGAALTATAPATPREKQMLWVRNRGSSSLTFARNGKTIDGANSDLTITAGSRALLQYKAATGWIRLGA